MYRGTPLTRERTPLGPYRRPMPRVLGGSQGGPRGVGVCYERFTHVRQARATPPGNTSKALYYNILQASVRCTAPPFGSSVAPS